MLRDIEAKEVSSPFKTTKQEPNYFSSSRGDTFGTKDKKAPFDPEAPIKILS
jgi:hypothetical protein